MPINAPRPMANFINQFIGYFNNSCLGYIIIASIILLICSLPWLFVRKYVRNLYARRLCSSLILAVAFAPGVFGGDIGVFIEPAIVIVVMKLVGYSVPSINLVISVLTILVLYGIIYLLQGLVAMYRSRQTKKLKQ